MQYSTLALPRSETLVEFLQQPSAYQGQVNSIECIQTHISWVFLTDQFAFKLKKPVRFGFLDFSTVALREQACREELRLNRRLARDIYLDVVPVSLHGKQLHLGRGGKVIDWLVKMRRLPAGAACDRMVRSRTISSSQVTQVAQLLTDFYAQLPPICIKTKDYLDELAHHVRDNEQELLDPRHGLDGAAIEKAHESQWRYLTLAEEDLTSRVLDGRIVEGHGDLRPEHIYLTPHPVIIDCIEFNRAYRILDVVDELSFFAMETAKLNAPLTGESVLATYCNSSGDHPPARLLAFYAAYRACVRAKVLALRAEQLEGEQRDRSIAEARCYLQLAIKYAREIGPPLLIVVRGLSGTGKSTLAEALANHLHITRLQTDAIRQELLGADRTAEYGMGTYKMECRDAVYAEMLRRAAKRLAQGQSIILDGTFLSAKWRQAALEIAAQHSSQPVFLRCECSPQLAMERIRTRADTTISDARAETYTQQSAEEDPDPAGVTSHSLNSAEPLPKQFDAAVARIKASFANNH